MPCAGAPSGIALNLDLLPYRPLSGPHTTGFNNLWADIYKLFGFRAGLLQFWGRNCPITLWVERWEKCEVVEVENQNGRVKPRRATCPPQAGSVPLFRIFPSYAYIEFLLCMDQCLDACVVWGAFFSLHEWIWKFLIGGFQCIWLLAKHLLRVVCCDECTSCVMLGVTGDEFYWKMCFIVIFFYPRRTNQNKETTTQLLELWCTNLPNSVRTEWCSFGLQALKLLATDCLLLIFDERFSQFWKTSAHWLQIHQFWTIVLIKNSLGLPNEWCHFESSGSWLCNKGIYHVLVPYSGNEGHGLPIQAGLIFSIMPTLSELKL